MKWMLPVGCLLALALGSPPRAVAQEGESLAEIAEKEKRRRKGTSGKVYTNADLDKGASKKGGEPSDAGSAPTSESGSDLEAERGQRKQDERSWRARMQVARDAITTAEAAVAKLKRKLASQRGPQSQPTQMDGLRQDPDSLVTSDERRAELEKQLEEAEAKLAAARQALEDLEEDARREGIPPGWLRE